MGDDCMKLLVLEQNELVSKIYKNIFRAKNYDSDIVRNDSECLDRINENYDYVVVHSSENDSETPLEVKIREIKPAQKIFSLSQYIRSNDLPETQKVREIIEKPFALLTLVAKLESESAFQNN